MSDWISVKDGCPPDNREDTYLTCHKSQYGDFLRVDLTDWIKGHWEADVTHWMTIPELPEPPK